MKINMEFNLPEEISELESALYDYKFKLVLRDFDNELRKHIKYGNYKEWNTKTVESIRKLLYDFMKDENARIFGG